MARCTPMSGKGAAQMEGRNPGLKAQSKWGKRRQNHRQVVTTWYNIATAGRQPAKGPGPQWPLQHTSPHLYSSWIALLKSSSGTMSLRSTSWNSVTNR